MRTTKKAARKSVAKKAAPKGTAGAKVGKNEAADAADENVPNERASKKKAGEKRAAKESAISHLKPVGKKLERPKNQTAKKAAPKQDAKRRQRNKQAAKAKNLVAPMHVHPPVIRDPIHGDITLDPVCAAVIDHVAFQRLRYVRQNALLHMIWPGAVHTRFAHSIGTMHVACRVFDTLFRGLEDDEAVGYLRMVFACAALLHDVGHCAFSHSIETIRHQGRPYLGLVGRVATDWQEQAFLAQQLGPTLRLHDSEFDSDNAVMNHEKSFFPRARLAFGEVRLALATTGRQVDLPDHHEHSQARDTVTCADGGDLRGLS